MALKTFRVHLSQNFCLPARMAHVCLTPSIFENLKFFVRSEHIKKSHPAQLSRKRLQPRVPIACIRTDLPQPEFVVFGDRRMAR